MGNDVGQLFIICTQQNTAIVAIQAMGQECGAFVRRRDVCPTGLVHDERRDECCEDFHSQEDDHEDEESEEDYEENSELHS
uniref:Uncharacterized protein n=1 Tax=Ditylenchus dipsaci TaxID=166011 RepID=A0A915EMZ6_9BILA